MKTFKVGDNVRLTARALQLSCKHSDWWAIEPDEVQLAKNRVGFIVTRVDSKMGYIELNGFSKPWSWNPKLFTKRSR